MEMVKWLGWPTIYILLYIKQQVDGTLTLVRHLLVIAGLF